MGKKTSDAQQPAKVKESKKESKDSKKKESKKTKSSQDKQAEEPTGTASASATGALGVAKPGVAIDPAVDSLFAKSAGPIRVPPFVNQTVDRTKSSEDQDSNDENVNGESDGGVSVDANADLSSASDESENDDDDDDGGGDDSASHAIEAESTMTTRKRKRRSKEDEEERDLEAKYLQRLEREEAKRKRMEKEEKEQDDPDSEDKKKRKHVAALGGDESSSEDGSDEDEDASSDASGEGSDKRSSTSPSPPPAHETQTPQTHEVALDRSVRTVFLGNVSSDAIRRNSAKKALITHISSFLSFLPTANNERHQVESLRFRSTAFSTTALPRRAAFAKKELMDSTTPSTNAYVIYSTAAAARRAPAALNGTIVLDRHLRVDNVAHPAPVDNKRCVFVGNLDFMDDEANSATKDGGDDNKEAEKDGEEKTQKKNKKNKQPADVEEGLWRTFNDATKDSKTGKGCVESVRVVRDRATRVGKGFAYVQFTNANGVEAALLLDGQKFPPMLPRKLRVTRARKIAKKPQQQQEEPQKKKQKKAGRASQETSTLQGRAKGLLGRAGAAILKELQEQNQSGGIGEEGTFVFEGHRASESNAGDGFKVKTKSRGAAAKKGTKAKGKPKNRSTKRAAAYKASSKAKK